MLLLKWVPLLLLQKELTSFLLTRMLASLLNTTSGINWFPIDNAGVTSEKRAHSVNTKDGSQFWNHNWSLCSPFQSHDFFLFSDFPNFRNEYKGSASCRSSNICLIPLAICKAGVVHSINPSAMCACLCAPGHNADNASSKAHLEAHLCLFKDLNNMEQSHGFRV